MSTFCRLWLPLWLRLGSFSLFFGSRTALRRLSTSKTLICTRSNKNIKNQYKRKVFASQMASRIVQDHPKSTRQLFRSATAVPFLDLFGLRFGASLWAPFRLPKSNQKSMRNHLAARCPPRSLQDGHRPPRPPQDAPQTPLDPPRTSPRSP